MLNFWYRVDGAIFPGLHSVLLALGGPMVNGTGLSPDLAHRPLAICAERAA